jgi:hypothetical protein
MLEIVADDAVIGHTCTYLGVLKTTTTVIGRMQIHGSFTLNV